MSRSEGPEILFGPYGTALELRGAELGIPDLHHSAKILEGGAYRAATIEVARRHAVVADIATTNTYGSRVLLRDGDLQLYRDVVEAHHSAVIEALNGSGPRKIYHAVGGTCAGSYDPDDAPSMEDARDFHAEQLAVAKGLQGISAVLFETINTSREAMGIALAAKAFGLPVILSFVIDKHGRLLSGESLADSMAEIDDASGSYPLGYSLNCCPKEGIAPALDAFNANRVIGVYPNASSADPRTFDGSEGVMGVEDHELYADVLAQIARTNNLAFVSGCCGIDEKLIGSIRAKLRK